ncbi:MAG TPA: hypothetical protein VGB12_11455, partial [bacterium]
MKRSIRNLNGTRYVQRVFRGAASVMLIVGGAVTDVRATEPCDDFGECRALIEINSTDGDIGFHWLID